jgi:hypothetical protein
MTELVNGAVGEVDSRHGAMFWVARIHAEIRTVVRVNVAVLEAVSGTVRTIPTAAGVRAGRCLAGFQYNVWISADIDVAIGLELPIVELV